MMAMDSQIDRATAIRRIRAALKKRSGRDWSVTGDRGTAYGWLTIDAPPPRRTWKYVRTRTPDAPAPGAVYRGVNGVAASGRAADDQAEYRITAPADDPWACEAVREGRPVVFDWEVEDPAYEFGHASPADRQELARLLGLRTVHPGGVSVPDSQYYREFVDRAEGLPPAVFGEQYRD